MKDSLSCEAWSEGVGAKLLGDPEFGGPTPPPHMGSSAPRAAHSLWKEKPMFEALLDPEVLGNAAFATLLILTMFVVQRWVDKHRPHH